MIYLNLLYVSGQQRPDEFEAKKLGSRAMLVKGKTKEGPHVAMMGFCGNPPFTDIETDAAAYYITGSQLHLAGVRTLRAKVKGALEEILWTQRSVNAMIDFQTGKAQIEVPGDQAVHAKVARAWTTLQAGTQTVALAEADALPKLREMVDFLWRNCPRQRVNRRRLLRPAHRHLT